MTHGSLFSGIGGFDIGFERAGIKTVWQVEIDDYCRRVLARHFPDARRFDDIARAHLWADETFRLLNALPAVDIISGGFPCQDISNAGKRAGIDGERSGLWSEFARLIRELRPRYVVVENVAALLGRGMERVLGDLAACGYDAEWDCLPAAAFGAPHIRYRVWIVAYPDGQRPRWAASVGQAGFAGLRPQDPGAEPHGPGAGALADTDSLGIVWDSGLSGDLTGSGDARTEPRGGGWWDVEPDVGGTLDGFPAWLDRSGGRLVTPHMLDLAYAVEGGPREALRAVRSAADEAAVRDEAGGSVGVPPSAVLLTYLRQLEEGADQGRLSLARPPAPRAGVRGVREDEGAPRPSRRRDPKPQRSDEPANALHALSQLLARDAGAAWSAYRREDAELVLSRWAPGWEDGIARVASGVPARVDRLKGLGNAIVPQIAEWIGRQIVRAEA